MRLYYLNEEKYADHIAALGRWIQEKRAYNERAKRVEYAGQQVLKSYPWWKRFWQKCAAAITLRTS
jgi:hypothetical protein